MRGKNSVLECPIRWFAYLPLCYLYRLNAQHSPAWDISTNRQAEQRTEVGDSLCCTFVMEVTQKIEKSTKGYGSRCKYYPSICLETTKKIYGRRLSVYTRNWTANCPHGQFVINLLLVVSTLLSAWLLVMHIVDHFVEEQNKKDGIRCRVILQLMCVVHGQGQHYTASKWHVGCLDAAEWTYLPGVGMGWTTVLRTPIQPSPVHTKTDHKQLENVE
jgi:hypothetical protein